MREVFPETREQQYFFNKNFNDIAALSKSCHRTLAVMKEIYNAEDIDKTQ